MRMSGFGLAAIAALTACGCDTIVGVAGFSPGAADGSADSGGGDATPRTEGGRAKVDAADAGRHADGRASRDARGDADSTVAVDARRDGDARPATDARGDADAREVGDAHVDADARARKDSGLPEAGPPAFTCSVLNDEVRLVDDLSSWDAASSAYTGRLFIAPGGDETGFYVLAQVNGDGSELLAYQVSPGGSVTRNGVSGLASSLGGLSLFDVHATGSGLGEQIEALTSYTSGGFGPGGVPHGMQVLDLLWQGELDPSAVTIASGKVTFHDARLIDLPSTDTGPLLGYIATESSELLSGCRLVMGTEVNVDGGIAGDVVTVGGLCPPSGVSSAIGFASGADIYALVVGPPVDGGVDGGYADIATSDTLTEAGVLGGVEPPASPTWSLLGARTSASDPTRVVVLAAASQPDGTIAPCGATLPPMDLPGTVLCGPSFTTGSRVAATDIPLFGVSSTAWSSDDFVQVGASYNGLGLLLLWLGPGGRVVANGLPVNCAVPIVATAVQFDQFSGESSYTTFDVAWIEQYTTDAGAPSSQRIYAAKIACAPVADGG
jgi:hypothetical protein